ncbi:endonuclease/exonuclease/phosphatase family protein [Ktedonosporobacter rubrisoli]|uniref:Endonuclease/exonuclease/phosphatase family protein n=1 Tax=Ktedonosporobacter rubrisoli TaxID=2509675 RepID=A0A4P6JZA6_KTERU|nr:endonuclease/exonuclease/phosphatase family protein [Ktedonosporobacter rubrisoli]QBD81127.1 endonuclease/exonuclease/phosphatase family protein [Ktedonosporobacter rubrisoli]
MTKNQFPGSLPRPAGLRVLTLNLWGQHGAWTERREALIAGLQALQPDLLAFQESIKSDAYDQMRDLLGPDWNISHQQGRDPEGMGISIASRWPLDNVQEVDLHVTPRTEDFPCATLIAEVQAPAPVGPLLFANHFPNWQLNFAYERELQTVVAARVLEERVSRKSQHVVLVGDLDADPQASSIRFWTGRQSLGEMSVCYRDAWESRHPDEAGHTFTAANPLMVDWDWPFGRIDYIFVRCGEHGGPTLQIASCQRIFAEPLHGVWASDHFGLVADLVLPHA